MDGARFDDLARTLGARLPRRALGGLLAAALAALDIEDTGAKARRNGARQEDRAQRASRDDRRGERRNPGKDDRRDADSGKRSDPLRAEGKRKKKRPACVAAGGSCKKPKKRKAKKCCAGLACDATTKKCLAAGGGGDRTGSCDEPAFAECFAPWTGNWEAALQGCTGACEDTASLKCRQCLEQGLADLVEPFAFCFGRMCSMPGVAASRASEAGTARCDPLKFKCCDPLELSKCNTTWLLGEVGADLLLTLAFNVAGLASAIVTGAAGAVFNVCNDQFGCLKGQFCIREHGVCCQDCARYEPTEKTCKYLCTADEVCNQFGRCVQKHCKQCIDYVEGNILPCGQRTNNCGQTITCTCPGSRRCKNGRCASDTCPRGSTRAEGAGDECCLPLTCEELGKSCGRWSDGCGDTLDCGTCATAEQPGAICDFTTGQCVCYPDDACLVGTCGAMSDGCGGTIDCGECDRSTRPRAFCGTNNQCQCAPYTCSELGKTCGVWDDGCGGTVDCGSSGRKTCAELGKECGVWGDGCNGTIDCGGCATENRPRATCDETGRCVCFWDGWCNGDCGPEPDGCGGTVDCGRCDSPSSPKAYCGEDRQCHCEPDTCADLGKTCGTWPDGCGGSVSCGPAELLCGSEEDPVCCAAEQTCCRHGPDYWGLPSECCDWPVCNRYPGGAFKGCCPAGQQCTENNGSKACCPEGWTCRGANSSHPATNCCIKSGHGDAALHMDQSLCCSGELESMWPHICK